MRIRSGFARLMPLLALTGLAAGTIALLASAQPVQAPARAARPTRIIGRYGGGCCDAGDLSRLYAVQSDGIVERLTFAVPRCKLCGLHLGHTEWRGADLHGATFTDCHFDKCDLSGADLRGVTFEICDLRGAKLDGANLTGAVTYLTQWPPGLSTPLQRWSRGIVEGVGP